LSGVTVTIHRDIIRVESGAVAKPNHRWKMPDHGAWNDKGELTLTGRSGREINIGGKKVHPSEIEHALRAIPGIADAIVLTDPNPERVLIRAAVETSLSLVEVQRALTLRLPDWKHPKDYLLMPKLPRTSRGKIDVLAFKKL
jgi:acyl-coenzyme A synthetase/AMP-(fatty) acid ligase